MSVGDKRWEGHPARDSGQAHKPTGTVPGHQGTRIPPTRGRTTHFTLNKHHQRHSKPTLRNTRAHTQTGTQHAHMCRHTDAHTGLPVVDTRASVLPSESLSLLPRAAGQCLPDWGWGGDQLHPWEHQLLQVGAGWQVPRQQPCSHREPPDSGDQE